MNTTSFDRALVRASAMGIASVLAAIVAGGLGGRIMMRVAAALAPANAQNRLTDAGALIGKITVDGSLFLILFGGIFAGVLGAAIVAVLEPWTSTWRRRYAAGTVGLLMFAVGGFILIEPDGRDFFLLKNEVAILTMIFLMFITYGFLVVVIGDRLISRWTRPMTAIRRTVLGVVCVGGGFVSIASLFTAFFEPEFSSHAPTQLVPAGLVILGVATVVHWMRGATSPRPRWLSALAYSGLALAFVTGMGHTVHLIQQI